MNSVRQLLHTKGSNIFSISPSASVYEALRKMADNDIGSLVVVEKGKLAGLFTERDYARKIALKGRSSMDTPVADLLDHETVYVTPDDTVEQCMALMTTRRTRHLPVLENDEVVGIVSIGDVVKQMIAEKDSMIEQLQRYVYGG